MNVPTLKRMSAPVALVVSVAVMAALAFVSGASGAGSTSVAAKPVAHNGLGSLSSRVVGQTSKGATVTGDFVPLKFIKKNGHLRVRGLIEGVVHKADGSTRTFDALRTIRVKSINGTPAHTRTAANAAATCAILHLTLAPIDLDLLGLKVHTDKIVINIDAQSGPGNLLGNLLCSVSHLLDGTDLSGVLGKVTNLLNQILARLNISA